MRDCAGAMQVITDNGPRILRIILCKHRLNENRTDQFIQLKFHKNPLHSCETTGTAAVIRVRPRFPEWKCSDVLSNTYLQRFISRNRISCSVFFVFVFVWFGFVLFLSFVN